MSVHEKMTAIADAIRAKTGGTDPLTLDGMAEAIAGIETGGGDYTSEQIKALLDGSITEFVIPDGMTAIGRYAFYYKTKLANVAIPDSCTEIGISAFQGCSAMMNVNLPANLTTLKTRAFAECNLSQLEGLPETLKIIDELAFTYCKFANIRIPANVTTVGKQAFQSCSNLESVTFEGTPTSMSATNVFANCNNLLTINVPWAEGDVSNAPWGATNATINYNYTET